MDQRTAACAARISEGAQRGNAIALPQEGGDDPLLLCALRAQLREGASLRSLDGGHTAPSAVHLRAQLPGYSCALPKRPGAKLRVPLSFPHTTRQPLKGSKTLLLDGGHAAHEVARREWGVKKCHGNTTLDSPHTSKPDLPQYVEDCGREKCGIEHTRPATCRAAGVEKRGK